MEIYFMSEEDYNNFVRDLRTPVEHNDETAAEGVIDTLIKKSKVEWKAGESVAEIM